jgi:GNAT superfamily N-acetyltransferase
VLNVLRMRLTQIADLIKSEGWSSFFKEVLFLNRAAIVVEKNLSEVAERLEPLATAKLKVLEIDQPMLRSGAYRFAVTNRYLKALNYLRIGYSGYALVRDNLVIGDMWCDPHVLHEDNRRFGFTNEIKSHICTFDIFVAPAERKGGVSAAFQNRVMLALRSKGYTKAYGFYWADNLQAQWCTRVTNKWKEVRAFSVSRFLIFKWAAPLLKGQADLKVRPPVQKYIPSGARKEI